MEKIGSGSQGFVGRVEELAKLNRAVDEAKAGKGNTIFISGEAGIGKTTLIENFLNNAHDIKILRGAALADIAQPFRMFSSALEKEMASPLFEEQENVKFVKIFAVNRAGLLAGQASSEEEDMDADIFAGMLSAVQDFVGDSFGQDGKSAHLGRLEYGDMKILMEHGLHLFLTAVFQGNEHPDMKPAVNRALREMEEQYGQKLENWSGNMSELADLQNDIEKLAQKEFSVRKNLEGVKMDTERLRIADDVLTLVQDLAIESPIMMVLEDLHWADESSLYVLKYLARNIRDSKVMLLGTMRPSESDLLQTNIDAMLGEKIIKILPLVNLDKTSTLEIIQEMYPANDFPETLAQRLFDQSKGNPLFVTEMLKGMLDTGSIVRNNGGFSLISEAYQIPASVEEVVNTRLDALDHEGMAMVEYASCIGISFETLAAYSITSLNQPEDAFGKALGSGIIIRYNGTSEFSHALFQSAIYGSIGDRWKMIHHKNIAEYYETKYTDNLDKVIYEIARHYANSREHEKTAQYCIKAGEKAEASYAMEQALDFYRKALATGPEEDADLLERIGDVLATMGNSEEAIDSYQKAKEATTDRRIKSRLLRKCATILTNNGEFERSLELMQEARTLLEQENTLENGRILFCDGITYWRKGEFDLATEILQEALSIYEKNPDAEDTDIGAVLNGIGNIHNVRGEVNPAMEYYQRSLDIYQKIGKQRDIALLLGNVAGVYFGMGKLDDALKYFNQSLEIREQIKDLLGIAQTLNNMGLIYQNTGKLDESMDAYNKGLEIAKKLGSKLGISITLYNIGSLHHSKGELDTALEVYEKGLEIRNEIGDKQGIAYFYYIIGRIMYDKGQKDQAKKYYDETLEVTTEIGDKQLMIFPLTSMAEMKLEDGDSKGAFELAKKALDTAIEAGIKGEEGRCHRVMAEVHISMNELTKATEELEIARKILEEVGQKEELAWVFKEYALFYKANGQPKKAKDSIQEAISMFEGMGMKLWAGQCKKLSERL